jgi:tetratricopeptide (TPR) repeat protein
MRRGDLLASLVDKSLALLEEREGGEEARYRLLEMTRQYAAERLTEAAEEAALRERHLDWCLSLATEAELRLRGPEQAHWLDYLETEHDNLRAGLGWSLVQEGAAPRGTALAALIAPFWAMRGHHAEGRAWLERLLAATTAAPPLRAGALRGLGHVAFLQGDHARAVASYLECLALFQDLDDRHGCATTLLGLGGVARLNGNYAQAKTYLERSLALSGELGDQKGCADALRGLGLVASLEGDYALARTYFEEGLPPSGELGDRRDWAVALLSLGDVACLQGDYARAKTCYEEGLAIYQELDNRQGWAIATLGMGLVTYLEGDYARARAYDGDCLTLSRELGVRATCANALLGLGQVACLQGDHLQAGAYVEESLILYQELGIRLGIAESLELRARISAAQCEYRHATLLFAAASSLRGTVAAPLSSYDFAWYEQVLAAARAALGPEQFAVAWADGHALSLDDATALALDSDCFEGRSACDTYAAAGEAGAEMHLKGASAREHLTDPTCLPSWSNTNVNRPAYTGRQSVCAWRRPVWRGCCRRAWRPSARQGAALRRSGGWCARPRSAPPPRARAA